MLKEGPKVAFWKRTTNAKCMKYLVLSRPLRQSFNQQATYRSPSKDTLNIAFRHIFSNFHFSISSVSNANVLRRPKHKEGTLRPYCQCVLGAALAVLTLYSTFPARSSSSLQRACVVDVPDETALLRALQSSPLTLFTPLSTAEMFNHSHC